MGSGASELATDVPGSDLHLPSSGLRFSAQQVRSLNSYVDTLYEEDLNGRMSVETECAVESLVQRIVDGAGQRDPRFRCCHLIALHRDKKMRSRSLEYLVTLDSLPILNTVSDECRLQEGPVGYGKIRLTGREADKWSEFLTPTGYLNRDKVVERWVELVARCAQARGGGASRALGARAAGRAAPLAYCYLERVSHQAAAEHRLAIVEGAACVRVRVGAGRAEAKLVLGARAGGCSAHAYAPRVPLTHPLAPLHYAAAQADFYAAAVAPPPSIVSADRASTWQLWHPILEATLDGHNSPDSSIARVAGALNSMIDKMREGCFQVSLGDLDSHYTRPLANNNVGKGLSTRTHRLRLGEGYRAACVQGAAQLLSRHAAWCALRRRVERVAARGGAERFFLCAHIAHHLLLVLDDLLHLCEHGGVSGFVFAVERAGAARRGARAHSWAGDALALRHALQYLRRLAGEGECEYYEVVKILMGEDVPQSPAERLETALCGRWAAAWRARAGPRGAGAAPPAAVLRYLATATQELLACKNMVSYEHHNSFRANLLQATSLHQEHVEDLVHILAIMLDQARDAYLSNLQHSLSLDKELASYRARKWKKLKDYYDASSACLIDAARADAARRARAPHAPHAPHAHRLLADVLRWLYRGAKEDKKYLGPVLKPYLNDLYDTALENSWFLEDFEDKKCLGEFEGLKSYCLSVHEGSDPCVGLLDAAKKFAWAKALVDVLDRYRHFEFRLVFPTGGGQALSHRARLPRRARALTLSRRAKADAKLRLATRCVLAAFNSTLVGRAPSKQISHNGSTEEILTSVRHGNFWRNTTKPDVIPSTSNTNTLDQPKVRRRSRRSRPATSHGFPEITITNQSDTKTLRRKYHTLKSLVYKEPVESIKELRERPRCAGSTVRDKEHLSRPTILETLDFINGVKDSFCVEESGSSEAEESAWAARDECVVWRASPLGGAGARCGGALHAALGDLAPALLARGAFSNEPALLSTVEAIRCAVILLEITVVFAAVYRAHVAPQVLQELCALTANSEGALFALHRLARAARARSADSRRTWRLPDTEESAQEAPQIYRPRPPDYVSGDEAPQPPPLPRHSNEKQPKQHTDFVPQSRLETLQADMDQLQLISSKLSLQSLTQNPNHCTGIINPIYDIKMPRDKFTVKRTKSLGRSFSSRNLGIEITRYNLSLGQRNGKRTNDVVTAINGTTGETGLEFRNNFFHKNCVSNVVGDSYRISRVTID
ncbi:uncharacterized protein LOC113395772 [Vanessa tameamea]|uniref:Uncharacterized protein LOC113395772 n=1 Tax=Vanessa tameamea TaxID=334116 RepID=A0ABM4AN85_VANTA